MILEKPAFGTDSLPEEAAILLGAAVGDGCIARGDREGTLFITVSKREPHLALQLQDCVDAAKAWVFDGDRRGTRRTGLVATPTTLRVGTAVAAVLEELSRYAVLGEGSAHKRFTDAIYELDRESLAGVLKGLFSTDGTVANSRSKDMYVALDSTSLELLQQVQLLLLGFGIKAKIYENRRRAGGDIAMLPDGKGGTRAYYVQQMHSLRLSRSSRVTFEREIGFLPSSPKAAKLAELNASVGVYADGFVDRVASLTPCGVEDVFDLSEPRSHHFVANGIVVHNCSEYSFLDDTACNLASLNLLKFYDQESGRFLLEEYRHAIRIWTVVLEISVLMAQFPSREVARRSYAYRTLGLGFANLGTLLMVMGIPYDSAGGRNIGAALGAILSGEAYAASAEMAGELGAFARYAANRDPMLRVIRNHRRAAHGAPADEYEGLTITPVGLDAAACPPDLAAGARESWDRALALGEKHGYRNAQVTAIAPTGTIGLVMDCDTTGIEPDYALVKFKKLAGGGYFKIINQSVPPALRRLGYSEQQIGEITEYCVGRGTLAGAPDISRESLAARGIPADALDKVEALLPSSFSLSMALTPTVIGTAVLAGVLGVPETDVALSLNVAQALGFTSEEAEAADRYACGAMTIEGAPHLSPAHYAVFDTASRSGRWGTRYIAWKAHIDMMAAVQPYISGAISKTINMPGQATVEEIKEAYLDSWRKMLKAIALYRDGSKLSQPLSALGASADSVAEEIVAAGRAAREPHAARPPVGGPGRARPGCGGGGCSPAPEAQPPAQQAQRLHAEGQDRAAQPVHPHRRVRERGAR